MTLPAPIIDHRDRTAVLANLYNHMGGYLTDWSPKSGTASTALLHIYARYLEILIDGLNQVPERSLLAFLSTLGTDLLPAQAARVPLVFNVMESSTIDPPLLADSEVAAPVQPVPPSPLLPEGPSSAPQPTVFATTQTISLTRAQLVAVYSIKPNTDEYALHTTALTTGFRLFENLQPFEHALYLGHDELFALAGVADVRLSFFLGASGSLEAQRDLEIVWEYLSKDGWLPLTIEEERTKGLKQDGQIILRKTCGPDAKQETIHNHTSYWLRGRLITPLPPEGSGSEQPLPVLDTIRAQVAFTKAGLEPEAAFTNGLTVDTSKPLFPFGQTPDPYATFYLGNKEVFQRQGARVRLEVDLSQAGKTGNSLDLAWEYYNGTRWVSLEQGFEFRDGTQNFTEETGSISFLCPSDWAESAVNAEENYWLRVRITRGDYGQPLSLAVDDTGVVTTKGSNLRPPVIANLMLQYSYQTESSLLDRCLSLNNFVFRDHSETCQWLRQTFVPFEPVSDRLPAVYLGFDQPLPVGLISLYLHVPPEDDDSILPDEVNPFIWEAYTDQGWTELGILDETLGFRQNGTIQFIGPQNAVPVSGVGGELYRVRARLKQGEQIYAAAIAGLWLNALWATQRLTVKGEEVGISNGNPRQVFHFRRQRVPILPGEIIEAQEWRGSGADWETLVRDVATSDLRFEYDSVSGSVRSVWVRWHARSHLLDSGSTDRHYVLERATGFLRFGERVPPAGVRIIATYSNGGGRDGNVGAGAISQLRAGVPFLKDFTNPVAATGGAATETIAAVRSRGPQRLRHRDRAVSATDFEWLALEASPEIARVKCLPLLGPAGPGQRGWITLVVIPHSTEAQPYPTPALQQQIQAHLATRVPATMARRIRVIGPDYVSVSIRAEVVPLAPDQAAQVDARIRERLTGFLHPLQGGSERQGWAFGQSIYLSQIAALIETTQGVDYATQIRLHVNDQMFDEVIPVDMNMLVAAGQQELKLILGER